MAEAITYKAVAHKFDCGTDFSKLSVINFVGPAGAKACAYCCNMNLDLDGEPQAYGPLSKPKLRPKDNLGNAGWKREADNTALRLKYEAGKKLLSELEQKKVDLIAKAKPVLDPTKRPPATAKAAHDPAMVALDKQIAQKKAELRKLSFEHINANGNYSATNPKNFEKIFWQWYGVVALTPAQAKAAISYLEMSAKTLTVRKPVLDNTSGHATGLHLNDTVFALRLDTGDTLAFPFRDTGFGYKVAECSFAAFTGLGGIYHPERQGAAKFPNDFLLLYLAFPNSAGQTPASILAKFATASNAPDFPMILAFIAQTTAHAKAKGSKVVSGDPLKDFENWKKSPSKINLSYFDVINQGLNNAGSSFFQNFMRKHPSILTQGLSLQLPGKP